MASTLILPKKTISKLIWLILDFQLIHWMLSGTVPTDEEKRTIERIRGIESS